jgi:hypothetical protein
MSKILLVPLVALIVGVSPALAKGPTAPTTPTQISASTHSNVGTVRQPTRYDIWSIRAAHSRPIIVGRH